MLETITSYWFVTLPAVVTAFYLVRIAKRAQDAKKQAAKERVPVTRRNQYK